LVLGLDKINPRSMIMFYIYLSFWSHHCLSWEFDLLCFDANYIWYAELHLALLPCFFGLV
jgi:hypothetical protein